MPRLKSQSPPTDSPANTPPEVRRRVVKACQRCRLKKCKCDGSSPCSRCKADDAICAYGKHKKSDKTVYRRGYVQMLERQHSQLIAGVHEMYKLLQSSDGWPGPKLEPSSRNGRQPFTHQILEELGVLQSNPQDDADDPDGEWQTFEYHPQDDGMMYTSAAASPSTQTTFSPLQQTLTQPAMPPHQTIVDRRRIKYDTGPQPVDQYMVGTPLLTTQLPHLKQGPPFSANMAYSMQNLHQYPNYHFDRSMSFDGNTLGRGGGGGSNMMEVDWTGMENVLDNTNNPPLLAQPLQTGCRRDGKATEIGI